MGKRMNTMWVHANEGMEDAIKEHVSTMAHRHLQRLGILAIAKDFGKDFMWTYEFFMKNKIRNLEDLNGMELVVFFEDGETRKVRLECGPCKDRKDTDKDRDAVFIGYHSID